MDRAAAADIGRPAAESAAVVANDLMEIMMATQEARLQIGHWTGGAAAAAPVRGLPPHLEFHLLVSCGVWVVLQRKKKKRNGNLLNHIVTKNLVFIITPLSPHRAPGGGAATVSSSPVAGWVSDTADAHSRGRDEEEEAGAGVLGGDGADDKTSMTA